jgi:hypothetical protein
MTMYARLGVKDSTTVICGYCQRSMTPYVMIQAFVALPHLRIMVDGRELPDGDVVRWLQLGAEMTAADTGVWRRSGAAKRRARIGADKGAGLARPLVTGADGQRHVSSRRPNLPCELQCPQCETHQTLDPERLNVMASNQPTISFTHRAMFSDRSTAEP